MNEQSAAQTATALDSLWVLARLKDCICAVNGAHVEAILLLEQDVVVLPESDAVHAGIIHFRGQAVPVVDVRGLMGMPSRRQEQEDFEQMLERRKQDHIRWVNELSRCLQEDVPFTLATDPHKCAFGKWYDNFRPKEQSVAFHLRKIDEPHQKLHATAIEAFACSRECDRCMRNECRRSALQRASEEYMPQVLALLEESKQVFRDSYRRMVIVVSDGVHSRALLVDEVLSAEALVSMTPRERLSGETQSQLVTHIAQRKNDTHQILVLDMERLLA